MPSDITDPELGTLAWDDELAYWRHEDYPLSDRGTIRLSLTPKDDDSISPNLIAEMVERARTSLHWVRRHEPDLRLAIALRMLALYNESWREDDLDEQPINANEFAERIHLTSIDVQADGELGLYFDDGDIEMFGGHSIVAQLGTDHKLRGDPHLAG